MDIGMKMCLLLVDGWYENNIEIIKLKEFYVDLDER
jgi:hypothetical protein